MPNQDHRPKVTIEDLLRLKRAERPPAEFWNRFEGELRQKQLAALLEQRPWWHGLSGAMARKFYLPVGAAAVLGFTFVSFERYQAAHAVAPAEAPVHRLAAVRPAPPARPAMETAERRENAAPAATPVEVSLSDRLPDHAADLTPWSAPRQIDSPSAKTIAASIARLEVSEPQLASEAMGGFFTIPAVAHSDPDGSAELTSLSEQVAAHSRLLAQLDDRHFTPQPQAPQLVRERLARRLADSEFSDSFSRVGLERGGVSVKF